MPSQRFEISIPFDSEKAIWASDFLYPNHFGEIVIVDNIGQEFTAFDCFCIKKTIKIEGITIVGQYKTLIKGRVIPKRGILSLHFEGMEHFLNKSTGIININAGCTKEDNKWELIEGDESINAVIQISEIESLDLVISLLVKVREYFEYLIGKEIMVDCAVFTDMDGSSIEILNDNQLMSEKDCIFNDESLQDANTIVDGINKWLSKYSIYKEVIYMEKNYI